MIFLSVIGIFAFFLIPIFLVSYLLDKNDYYIFGFDVEPGLILWGVFIVEIALFAQLAQFYHFL